MRCKTESVFGRAGRVLGLAGGKCLDGQGEVEGGKWKEGGMKGLVFSWTPDCENLW